MFDSFDFDEEQKRIKEELLGIKRFKTVDGETLMNKQIDHKEQIISSVLPVKLVLLSLPLIIVLLYVLSRGLGLTLGI